VSGRVVLVVSILTHYRVRFHELVRERLATHNIRYDLIFGTPLPHEAAKGDTAVIPWGTALPSRPLRNLLWQPALRLLRGAQLVIVTQENRLLLNYLLQIGRLLPFRSRRVAFFGHGRNFQARNPNSRAERWKRYWATRVDWWFAYTEETRRHVEALGFPAERITVFNNAIDTAGVRADAVAVTPERLAERRAELGLGNGPIAIFVGGLYEDKRLTFLVAAADCIHERVPDFTLLIAGGGVERPLLDKLATDRPWLKILGPRFGADKVELMRLASLFLMPGLLGLAVLDAAAAGLPTVTTNFPWHSPEIAYVEDGVNGLVVHDWQNPDVYADAVATLLSSPEKLATITAGARALSESYSIEAMAERFADGIRAAMAASPR